MKKRKLISMVLAATLALTSLTGCGKKDSSSDDSVLRVGMECAYAPFNWSQETDELANGEKAVPIYGTNMYAYGYDVIVAEKLAKQMGKTLEIHKVEWDSIGMSLDAGDYDVIIAGMGRTKEREASYSIHLNRHLRTIHIDDPPRKGLPLLCLCQRSIARRRLRIVCSYVFRSGISYRTGLIPIELKISVIYIHTYSLIYVLRWISQGPSLSRPA